jgi:tRNA-Thr(GGU) m(6)t(6)A37 methyltransferase TsaA
VPSLSGHIVFEKEYQNPDALRGLDGFSHLWLIFDFSQSHRDQWSPTVRPPRLGGNRRIGVFASRSPFRPNPVGLSVVKLERVEKGELIVSGVDLLDGTPIYDIKPYLPFADSIPDAVGGYADDFEDYKLEVEFPEDLLHRLPQDKRQAAIDCLAQDPRPAYQEDERRYSMAFAGYDIRFFVKENRLTVLEVEERE